MKKQARNLRRLPACRELRKLGFIRDPKWPRPLFGDLLFIKTIGNRDLDLQLAENGGGRISHFLDGRMSTHPTYFSDIPSMKRAIAHETNRTDHTPRI